MEEPPAGNGHEDSGTNSARHNGGSTGTSVSSRGSPKDDIMETAGHLPLNEASKPKKLPPKEANQSTATKRELRKRKTRDTKQETPPPAVESKPKEPQGLYAIDAKGCQVKVNLLLAGNPFVPQDTATSPRSFVGNDGNQHYCQVCGDFGDVVCCDGCPRVYHHQCVPIDTQSRKSLDSDDDPWYCPRCMGEPSPTTSKTRSSARKEKGDRRTATQRCSDCQQDLPDRLLAPCAGCGSYVHSPSCSANGSKSSSKNKKVYCLNCKMIDQEEPDRPSDSVGGEAAKSSDAEGQCSVKKRKKTSKDDSDRSDKKLKKKKKKRRRSMSSVDSDTTKSQPKQEETPRGEIQAIPAFVFYLNENRWKIEKALSRQHRTFNRLPKGNERNALVAQEGAKWWTDLPFKEQQTYINMSMRDYEMRIIQWKEEKEARAYASLAGDSNAAMDDDGDRDNVGSNADAMRRYEMHERLFLSTSVGSKPYKLEPNQSYNRVLLDLLYDHRFHPLPMFSEDRPLTDRFTIAATRDNKGGRLSPAERDKITIPFFEVRGPISTTIGDECLGCSRGWNHFCPVVQRRVPAIEHRAKLQAPLSSLSATRVGLGLRPNIEKVLEAQREQHTVSHPAEVFKWRESDEARKTQALPIVRSCSVFDPHDRADEIVHFIEESVAMKIPEPPRPQYPEKQAKKKPPRTLPLLKNRESKPGEQFYNKCGRCRSIVLNDTGCVQCRRAQLVINKSKQLASGNDNDDDLLKVQTAMLGRVQLKEASDEMPDPADTIVAEAMVRERWCPSAILPPTKLETPRPRLSRPPAGLSDATDNGAKETDEEVEVPIDEEVAMDQQVESPDENVDVLVANKDEENGDVSVSRDQGEEKPNDIVNTDGFPPKRMRSTRIHTTASKNLTPERHERHLRERKKEASELHDKVVRIACYAVLHALMRRDPLHLFAKPVTAEGYATVVRNPIDFEKIRQNVLADKYTSLGAFMSDAKLLCENALAYNPPASVYYKTAQEMRDLLTAMNKRASNWIGIIKDAHSSYVSLDDPSVRRASGDEGSDSSQKDCFAVLREKWPEGVRMLEQGDSMRDLVDSDFMRTKENEVAFYGCLAVRRAAAAGEASLAPYTDTSGMHNIATKRKHYEDEDLREFIDDKVSTINMPQLQTPSTWREESVVRLVRKVQKARLERQTASEAGCSRCDADCLQNIKQNFPTPTKAKKRSDGTSPRVHASRTALSTGIASMQTCVKVLARSNQSEEERYDSVNDACVSVRGSKVHGMGLFADQPFKKGDVVAEYLGEYVVNPIAEARETEYGEQRIKDYQFRIDDQLVIDATKRGGFGRYINHNCSPNCSAKIIPGKPPSEHLRRVMIVAQREIKPNEEISYDYQFPLELDLSARIPCNCQSDACRGFMNWDLPEKGSNNRALLVQKRGANMRDRIRRLNRPLKRDE